MRFPDIAQQAFSFLEDAGFQLAWISTVAERPNIRATKPVTLSSEAAARSTRGP